jgi:hypothetical protein
MRRRAELQSVALEDIATQLQALLKLASQPHQNFGSRNTARKRKFPGCFSL